ncbi:MAG: ChaN family lipoprotein [Pseudomonadota bacterium]
MIRTISTFVVWAVLTGAALAFGPDDFAGADVVILGERHDNPVHHEIQARAVAMISPAAIVWEMMVPEQAALVDPALGAAEQGALLGWEEAGWPDFSMYHPIMASAPGARHYGAAVPRAAARAVIEGDVTDHFPEPILFGLDAALPTPEQAARNQMQFDAHCGMLPPDLIPDMVDVQRLRDATLANVAIEAWRETGGPVVIITGNGHARADWGVPRFLARAAPDAVVITLGQGEGGVMPEGGFDILRDAPTIERPDPCGALR